MALQPFKNFNASHSGDLMGERLSFELFQVRLQNDYIFMMMIKNYSHKKQTASKMNGNFYCTAWEGTWVKNLGNGLPT